MRIKNNRKKDEKKNSFVGPNFLKIRATIAKPIIGAMKKTQRGMANSPSLLHSESGEVNIEPLFAVGILLFLLCIIILLHTGIIQK